LIENRIALSAERAAVQDWETAEGGGVRAAGVGAGITGFGGDLIIIDDPVKSREEAESLAYRDRVWDWYTDDLYTRLEPDGAIILIMTRWHEDDLAGRILASEDGPNWTVACLPAEAEVDDPLGREIGEPLCPARYDTPALEDRKRVLGVYGYSALFQQRPAPRSGGMFKREWFEIVAALPAGLRRVRYWDMAASAEGDWTAGVLMSMDPAGSIYIEDVARIQGTPGTVEKLIVQTAALDGPQVQVWMEQEPGASGVNLISYYARVLAGYGFHGNRASGDKITRADPLASQAEVGNVKILRGYWNPAFLEELALFPKGRHDDQVDGASGAFAMLIAGQETARRAPVKILTARTR
jgi:predicted phage terminase large subunit-like protein